MLQFYKFRNCCDINEPLQTRYFVIQCCRKKVKEQNDAFIEKISQNHVVKS